MPGIGVAGVESENVCGIADSASVYGIPDSVTELGKDCAGGNGPRAVLPAPGT